MSPSPSPFPSDPSPIPAAPGATEPPALPSAPSLDLTDVLADGALAIVAYAVVGVLLLIVGFYVIDLVTPGRLNRLVRTERNPNATLIAASGVTGIGLVVAASIWSSGGLLREGLIATLVFGLVGIAAQTVGMIAFDLVAGISVRRLVAEPTLQPAAILLAVTHLVIGLITAVALL